MLKIKHWFKDRLARENFLLKFITVTVIAVSFSVGYTVGLKQPRPVILENLSNTELKDQKIDFGIFWEAWDLLKREHLKGAEAKDKDLVYGSIRGLVNSLNDPHTVFFPPEDSKKFEEDVIGNFGGIGAEIGIKNKQLVVIAPLKNTPAERTGLKAGDKILAINEKGTDGIDVNEAVKKIRGDVGTAVTLTILRDNWEKPQDIKIIRENITIPTIESKPAEDKTLSEAMATGTAAALSASGKNITYISLFSFNQNAPFAFYKEALKALVGRADGIVLDLRNNPGGFLEVSINIASWFADKGTLVVSEKFRDGKELVFRAEGSAALKNIPTVILVNKGSASASEILAGALRAIRGVKLVGAQTFGKGTVQELKKLSDNSEIKLTVANWVLPDGTIIDEKGLKPDFEVEIKDEDAAKKKDPQLDKAIQVLLQEIK